MKLLPARFLCVVDVWNLPVAVFFYISMMVLPASRRKYRVTGCNNVFAYLCEIIRL